MTFLPFKPLCFVYIVVNIMKIDAMSPGSIHHFLHKEMPVSSQEYDSCYPFV